MRELLLLSLLFSVLAGCGTPAPKGDDSTNGAGAEVAVDASLPQECDPNPTCPGSTCPTAITPELATPPTDACPRFGEFQSDVDVFSWNSFIALNWPANLSSCTADASRSILDGKGPVVWQTYSNDTTVFVSSGQPAAWCSSKFDAPHDFGHFGKASVASLAAHSGLTDAALSSILEAIGGPLTDQSGRFVRFQKLINHDEYSYIIDNDLWNRKGQVGKQIEFPQTPTGAIEVKAAWKVLNQGEVDGGRFYTTKGIVYNDADGTRSPGKNPVTLGLVGLHLIHKTLSQPRWFWSTFEHVDNVTSSFFNPDCEDCEDNTQTAVQPYKELNPDGSPANDPVQVTRVTPIEAAALNTYYRGLLAGSVWANYELVSTQWATGASPGGAPPVVANTTMETFIQERSSCMGCHDHAQTTDGKKADFSFLLSEAR